MNNSLVNCVKLISITPNAERIIAFCARVSSPENQQSEKIDKLLRYCITHSHWSVFEMANMTIEINTTRAISAQIIRHKAFSFQEFSQRYSNVQDYIPCQARLQNNVNRQQSIDNCTDEDKEWFLKTQEEIWKNSYAKYEEACKRGIAKECSRFLLPLNTKTTLYMNGNIRNWIHYINLRSENGTQKEHMEIAKEIQKIFINELPIISKALNWIK